MGFYVVKKGPAVRGCNAYGLTQKCWDRPGDACSGWHITEAAEVSELLRVRLPGRLISRVNFPNTSSTTGQPGQRGGSVSGTVSVRYQAGVL